MHKIAERLSEKREIQKVPKWEVPILSSYNSKYKPAEYQKSIMKLVYLSKPSEPERKFMELLDNSKKVKWWYKNEENEIKYFAVIYEDEDDSERTFYVDFIVQFEDGTIGLFDTKSGITTKEAVRRLKDYENTSKNSEKGKKLWGGIVVNIDGSWRYNDSEVYTYIQTNMKGWKFLQI